MSGDVKRSDSRGDINDLLASIRGIVDENKETIDELKAIREKNEQTAHTKKRVDIPSVVSGRKKSEIDIPHKKTKTGEHHGSILKRSKSTNEEQPDYPLVHVGTHAGVHAAGPLYSPDSTPRPRATSPRTRLPRRDEGDEKRRSRRDKSTERKRKIDAIRNKHYANQKPVPPKRDTTSQPRSVKSGSPAANSKRSGSPETGSKRSGSPGGARRSASPRLRHRSLSGCSDTGHGHYFRIRKDSTGSVEILPEYIEENYVVTETVVSPGSSIGDLHREEYLVHPTAARPGVSPGSSLPRNVLSPCYSDYNSSKWYAKAGLGSGPGRSSSLKRRIILEKCPDCDGADSPPEIEIRICSKDKCSRYNSGSNNSLNTVPQHNYSLNRTPDPPLRSTSLNIIPSKQDSSTRPRSPSSVEVERMTRRLNQLKQEVDSVLKEVGDDTYPLSVSVKDKRDSGRYYRARYHSAPQSPSENKTTSTTDILSYNQVYYPAKHEQINLSTQSIDLPLDDGLPLQLEVEEESIAGEDAMPDYDNLRSYDNEFETECDLTAAHSVPHYREEDLVTPPPVPPRSDGITLNGDNLFDPFHIGTTYVVLSRQYHGRYKFETPADPNTTAPPSPGLKPKQYPPGRHSPTVLSTPRSASGTDLSSHHSPASNRSDKRPANDIHVDAQLTKRLNSAPVPASPTPRKLYQPRCYDPVSGSVMSLASIASSRMDLDEFPSKLVSAPAAQRAGSPAPKPSRAPGPVTTTPNSGSRAKPMSPEQRRKFNRPQKEQAETYREVPVDCGAGAPPDILNHRKPSLQETPHLEKKNPASRAYHLQTINGADPARRSPGPTDKTSSLPRYYPGRPYSPFSQNTLRREMPDVKFLGDNWKEMGQRLGYDNSHIACFARDFPEPGVALLDHWSRQPDSKLEDLLFHLKDMGSWKTADALDKTLETTHV